MKRTILLTLVVLIGITSSAFAALPTLDPEFAYKYSFFNVEDITFDANTPNEVDVGDQMTGIAWVPNIYRLSNPNGSPGPGNTVWSFAPGIEELTAVFKTTCTTKATSWDATFLYDTWTFSVDQFDVYYENAPTLASKYDAEDANFLARAGTGISGNEQLYLSMDDVGLNDAGTSNDFYWTSNRRIVLASGAVDDWTFNAGLYVSNPGLTGINSSGPGPFWRDVSDITNNPTKKVDFFVDDDIHFMVPGTSLHLAGSEGRFTGVPTPEPSSMLLFAMGIVGLATRIRRKKAA